jgi:hypothetical protein
MNYGEWCLLTGCKHGHCPYDCEHPQPFILDGRLLCGRCAAKDDELIDMIPCTLEDC